MMVLVRDKAKKERNEVVRNLVSFVRYKVLAAVKARKKYLRYFSRLYFLVEWYGFSDKKNGFYST